MQKMIKPLAYLFIVVLLVGNLCYTRALFKEVNQLQVNDASFQREFSLMLAQGNTTKWVIMDTCVRIFHYVKPHKHTISTCPECAELMKKHKDEEQRQQKLNGEL